MLALRPIADVVNLDVDNARVDRPLQQALTQVAGKHFREQGQDIECASS